MGVMNARSTCAETVRIDPMAGFQTHAHGLGAATWLGRGQAIDEPTAAYDGGATESRPVTP